MAETTSHTLKNKEVVAVICNLMKVVFFDNTRVNAKRTFRDLEAGKTLRLPSIKMKDESEVPVRMKLSVKNFDGSISFSYFRNHLGALMNRIAQRGQQDDLPIILAQGNQQRIVNVPVGHEADGKLNVLALAFTSGKNGIMVDLMYVDPKQLQRTGDKTEPAA